MNNEHYSSITQSSDYQIRQSVKETSHGKTVIYQIFDENNEPFGEFSSLEDAENLIKVLLNEWDS